MHSTERSLAAAFVVVAIVSGTLLAAPFPTATCLRAKQECVSDKLEALLKCHQIAEQKGIVVDPACLQKAQDKFETSCMPKAENHPPCATLGDAAALEATIDTAVDDIVTALDPSFPAAVQNTCSAKKKGCTAQLIASLIDCWGTATKKGKPVGISCLQKSLAKFNGGATPAKGCFEKLEASSPPAGPTPCLTYDDTRTMQRSVEDLVGDLMSALNPVSLLDLATKAGAGCGQSRDGNGVTLQTLACGGIDVGSGGSNQLEAVLPAGSTSRFSLSCNGSACIVAGLGVTPTGIDCTVAGCPFALPIPVANAANTTCQVLTVAANPSGAVDRKTGIVSLTLPLAASIIITGPTYVTQPCPVCSGTGTPSTPGTGTCDRGANAGGPCSSPSAVGLSRDCLPGGADGSIPAGVLPLPIGPLVTSGQSASSASGIFCSGQPVAGCFGDTDCRAIGLSGSPAGPLLGDVAAPATVGGVSCVSAGASPLVNFAYGLPAPGAMSIIGTLTPRP